MLILVAMLAAGVVWGAVAWRTQQGNASNVAICSRVNTLDRALITILNRSLKSLPTNSYYRRHPDELAIAIKNTHYALVQLERARC